MARRLGAWLRSLGAGGPAKRESGAAFEMLMRNSHDLIIRLSGSIAFSYVSPASMRIFGLPPETMIGRALRDFAVAEDLPGLIASGQELFSGKKDEDTHRFRIIRADGEIRWVEVNTQAERDLYGERTGDFVIVLRDVTASRELEQKLANLAATDGLTGLANRRAFDEALERAWRAAVRHRHQLSLLLLDVDYFKTFNDAYGHQVGDQCLCAIGAAVSSASMRPRDLVARYGGEEIAVILPDTDGPGAVDVANRILKAVRDLRIPHAQNHAGQGFVSVSVGVATAVTVSALITTNTTALVAAADRALYNAKDGGRNGLATALLMTAAPEA